MECPADSTISWAGQQSFLDAALGCPLDAVTQSDYVSASQNGLCNCTVALYGPNVPRPNSTGVGVTVASGKGGQPLDCQCYACPTGSRIGFAFGCKEPIAGPCYNFTCDGSCNGDLHFIDHVTAAPTAAPAKSAAVPNLAVPIGVWIVGLVIAKLLR